MNKVFKVIYDNGQGVATPLNGKEIEVFESKDYPHHYLLAAEGSHTGGGTLLKKYCKIVSPEQTYSRNEVETLLHKVLNLGMSIKEGQLNGVYPNKSGEELLQEWIKQNL